jgi:hypothetical protein
LTPPAHQQRAANIMTPGGFGNPPVLAKAFFNNSNLLCIRPAPTATSISDSDSDRKDLYFGSVSMVGHSAGSMLKSSAQKDGPRRGLTLFLALKSIKGRLSPAQEAFRDGVSAQRFGWALVRSLDDALGALADHGCTTRIAPPTRRAVPCGRCKRRESQTAAQA